MASDGRQRESNRERKESVRPHPQEYAKVAKQVREWNFRYYGNDKPLEFWEQVTRSREGNGCGPVLKDRVGEPGQSARRSAGQTAVLSEETKNVGRDQRQRGVYTEGTVTLKHYTGTERKARVTASRDSDSVLQLLASPLVSRSLSPVSEIDKESTGEISDIEFPSEEEDAGTNATEIAEVVAISSNESVPEDASEEEVGTETVSPEGDGRAREDLSRADTTVGQAQGVGPHPGSEGGHCPPMGGPAGGEEGSSRRVAAEAERRRGRGGRTLGAAAGAAATGVAATGAGATGAAVAGAAAAGAATAAAGPAAVAGGADAAAAAAAST
ncbi:protein FAM71B-like [Drosophila elegans]|uniref:protein FAM71B-like n=1 Tax=Drosophila elegans TaxID=30023 RepID=UPI001BC850C8|nr:protein FAM71B-like [Drosophila elegans]